MATAPSPAQAAEARTDTQMDMPVGEASSQHVSDSKAESMVSKAPEETLPEAQVARSSKGRAFWFSFIALVFSQLLSALDLTAVSTALPTIVEDLGGSDNFVWVGSAYALASTAILPLTGALADVFGRRPVLIGSIAFFALGSALAGAAQNMNMLIAARSE
jgi:hypothetical protein